MSLNDSFPSIDPGEFRHQFTLLEQKSGMGTAGVTIEYVPGKPPITAFGKQDFIRGTELIKSGQDVSQVYLKLTMWYRAEFSPNKRIQAPSGAKYIIQAVENVRGMNTYAVLTCLGVGENQ